MEGQKRSDQNLVTDWLVGRRETFGHWASGGSAHRWEEGPACWRRGHAWSGPSELEVPGGLQPQSFDRQLGQGRGLGGARKDEAPERGSVE